METNGEAVIENNGTKASWELSKDVTMVVVKGRVKESAIVPLRNVQD